jgi:di/tricarboxylate transporter
MTVEIALVLGVIAGALYLFASQKLPVDVTAILVLLTLMVIPLVGGNWRWLLDRGVDLKGSFPTVDEGLSGLSNPATVTVLAMFILSAGVQSSGLIDVLANRLAPVVGDSELRLLLVIALLVGVLSGFVNNTATVAVAIPMVLDLARRLKFRASRLLIPVSFFGMLGGTLTLVGTSTSILASSLLREDPSFGRDIGMFEFTGVGVIVLLTGLVYFVTIGRWLLPRQDVARAEEEARDDVVFEAEIVQDSSLIDRTSEDSGFALRAGVEVLRVFRGGSLKDAPRGAAAESVPLRAGDILQLRGSPRQVLEQQQSRDVRVLSPSGPRRADIETQLVRMLLKDREIFDGRPASQVRLGRRYGGRFLGLETSNVAGRLRKEQLHVGEIVLFESPVEELPVLRRRPDVVLLDEFTDDFGRRQMWTAGGLVAAVIGLAALTPLPIVVTALAGALAMVLLGVLRKEDMYPNVAWDVIFLLAGMIPLGIAMTKSGAADLAADQLATHAVDWHPLVVLMALYLVTTLLTELVSNNASVVILVPVAISLSQSLQIDVLPLTLVVMFAASTSFLTPIGYQTNTMIFGTGLYRFTDFAKVGAPLNALLLLVTCTTVWWHWIV